MTISPEKIKPISEFVGYYITEYGKICYYHKTSEKWMFCKKAETPGFVNIIYNGKIRTINQTHFADKYAPNWRNLVKLYNQATKVLKTPKITDGRYKPNVDRGRFGTGRL